MRALGRSAEAPQSAIRSPSSSSLSDGGSFDFVLLSRVCRSAAAPQRPGRGAPDPACLRASSQRPCVCVRVRVRARSRVGAGPVREGREEEEPHHEGRGHDLRPRSGIQPGREKKGGGGGYYRPCSVAADTICARRKKGGGVSVPGSNVCVSVCAPASGVQVGKRKVAGEGGQGERGRESLGERGGE